MPKVLPTNGQETAVQQPPPPAAPTQQQPPPQVQPEPVQPAPLTEVPPADPQSRAAIEQPSLAQTPMQVDAQGYPVQQPQQAPPMQQQPVQPQPVVQQQPPPVQAQPMQGGPTYDHVAQQPIEQQPLNQPVQQPPLDQQPLSAPAQPVQQPPIQEPHAAPFDPQQQQPQATPVAQPVQAQPAAPQAVQAVQDVQQTQTAGTHPHADKNGKIPYPALKVDAEGKPTAKLEAVPEDYDVRKFWTLKKTDFSTDAVYYRFKQWDAQKKADHFKQQAEDAERLGTSENAAKAKKLLEMQRRIATLKAQMESDGYDMTVFEEPDQQPPQQ